MELEIRQFGKSKLDNIEQPNLDIKQPPEINEYSLLKGVIAAQWAIVIAEAIFIYGMWFR